MHRFLDWLLGRDLERKEVPFIEASTSAITVQERAAQARQALNNEVLSGTFKALRDEAIEVWRQTSATDSESREFLWRQVKTIDLIQNRLKRYLNDAIYEEAAEKRRA